MVLTNATEPLLNRLHQVAPLANKPFPLSFRVSLDHPDPAKHDEFRGQGNFELALKTMRELHRLGFPEFHEPGTNPDVPYITESCMMTYKTEEQRGEFMCNFSKMVVKKGGRMRVYACTLVDDDEDYDLGGSLSEAMKVRVVLKHHRCYTCFANGASCSEL